MDTTQLLTNPVYHWYPANIYHKTFHRETCADTYTHKSPAPTNICSQCGQVIRTTTVEEVRPIDPQRQQRETVIAIVAMAIMLICGVIFVWCKLKNSESD